MIVRCKLCREGNSHHRPRAGNRDRPEKLPAGARRAIGLEPRRDVQALDLRPNGIVESMRPEGPGLERSGYACPARREVWAGGVAGSLSCAAASWTSAGRHMTGALSFACRTLSQLGSSRSRPRAGPSPFAQGAMPWTAGTGRPSGMSLAITFHGACEAHRVRFS
jgi:hypothetical protein